MIACVNMVCRAENVLGKGFREVSVIDDIDDDCPTYKFKVKYWSESDNSTFMSFKNGTLLIINGRLAQENGEVYIICERVQFLANENLVAKML